MISELIEQYTMYEEFLNEALEPYYKLANFTPTAVYSADEVVIAPRHRLYLAKQGIRCIFPFSFGGVPISFKILLKHGQSFVK